MDDSTLAKSCVLFSTGGDYGKCPKSRCLLLPFAQGRLTLCSQTHCPTIDQEQVSHCQALGQETDSAR